MAPFIVYQLTGIPFPANLLPYFFAISLSYRFFISPFLPKGPCPPSVKERFQVVFTCSTLKG